MLYKIQFEGGRGVIHITYQLRKNFFKVMNINFRSSFSLESLKYCIC